MMLVDAKTSMVYIYICIYILSSKRAHQVTPRESIVKQQDAYFGGNISCNLGMTKRSLNPRFRSAPVGVEICQKGELLQQTTWLVVWNINFIFPYIGNFIIPIDFHIFQSGGPTTNQKQMVTNPVTNS